VTATPAPAPPAAGLTHRRGASVRLLLDSFFDDEDGLRSNRATVDYLHRLAQAQGLDIEARLGNATGGGILAKLYLVRFGGE
jgi:cardiolipin synthase A/B